MRPNRCTGGDIELLEDGEGTPYLEFNEKVTKTRQGNNDPRAFPPKIFATNDDHCPIFLYHMFKNRRPQAMMNEDSPFYLVRHVKTKCLMHLTYVYVSDFPHGNSGHYFHELLVPIVASISTIVI